MSFTDWTGHGGFGAQPTCLVPRPVYPSQFGKGTRKERLHASDMELSTIPGSAGGARRRGAKGKHDVLLNTTNAWSRRFQREIHRGGKWKTRPALAASFGESENALPSTDEAVPSTLFYRLEQGDPMLGTFDQNILNSTLLTTKRRRNDQTGKGDKVLTLNRCIKPLTAVLEDPTMESKASDYDPSSMKASIVSR